MGPPDHPKPSHIVSVTVALPLDDVEKLVQAAYLLMREARKKYEAALAIPESDNVTQLEAWKRKKDGPR